MSDQIPLRKFRYSKDQSVPITVLSLDSISLDDAAGAPNRHTFYEIFLITGGKGAHSIDFDAHRVQPNTVFLVSPYQVHHWEIEEPVSGYVVLFEDSALLNHDAKKILLELYRIDALILDDAEQMQELLRRAADLEAQLTDNAPLHAEMNSLLLHALLLNSAQKLRRAKKVSQAHIAPSSLALAFTRLASRYYTDHRQTVWYADQLQTSSSYLSQAVRAETNATPGEYLRAKIVAEIKRQLLYTDLSVEAIASQLNFDNTSYFSRFFRRETGQSPREFVRSTKQN